MNLSKLNEKLQKEGQELLDKLKLLEFLRTFGPIEIAGSFRYGTMVDRDIDIAVIVNKDQLNKKLIKKFLDILLSINELGGLEMTDRVHHTKPKSPYGIWFGPKFIFRNNKWNIDIWFVAKDEP